MKRWYFDIASNMDIRLLDTNLSEAMNNGDYHHHNWRGPYKTFLGAKREAMKVVRYELQIAQFRFEQIQRLKKPKKNPSGG